MGVKKYLQKCVGYDKTVLCANQWATSCDLGQSEGVSMIASVRRWAPCPLFVAFLINTVCGVVRVGRRSRARIPISGFGSRDFRPFFPRCSSSLRPMAAKHQNPNHRIGYFVQTNQLLINY